MPAEIPDGAVIVARAILNSSLWTMRPQDCKVAVTCICIANFRPREWWDGKRNIVIGRGQFVRSWNGLSKAACLTIKAIRTSVQHLENTGFLARKSAGRYSIFTIPKYDHYQDLTKYSDSVMLKSGKTSGSSRAGRGQDAGNKQECKELEEGGGKSPEQAPPATEAAGGGAANLELIETVEAFSAWRVPGAEAKSRAIEDLLRQGVSHKRLRAAAEQNGTSDFFAIFDRLKNGKAEMPFVPSVESTESRVHPPVDDGREEKLKSIDDRLKDLPAEILKIWTEEASGRISKLGRKVFGAEAQIYIKSELRKRMATEMGFIVDRSFP